MIVAPPTAADLLVAPELAILAALELALVASVEAIMARHPELCDDFDFCESGLGTEAALALRAQAVALVATVNRYRLSLVVPGDDDI
jgi:hypothetical protein